MDIELFSLFKGIELLNLDKNDIIVDVIYFLDIVYRILGDYGYSSLLVDFLILEYYDELNILLEEYYLMYEFVDVIFEEEKVFIIVN